MKKHPYFLSNLSAYLLSLVVFATITTYAYGYFFELPYIGFNFIPSSNRIERIFVSGTQESLLQKDDQLLQVGSLTYERFMYERTGPFFAGYEPGQVVQIIIRREDKILTIPWKMPGMTRAEFISRLNSQWWIAYILWFFGFFGLLSIRPKDERWWLSAAFNYLTAIWLITGATSSQNLWGSHLLLRAAIWFCVPVYWHFHWFFPQPLRKVKWWTWSILYLLAAGLTTTEFLKILPRNAYYIGLLLAVVGSLALLVIHAVHFPRQRRDLVILGLSLGLVLIPVAIVNAASLFYQIQLITTLTLLVLPVLPGAYFYIIYRRQSAGMELRANRAVIVYIYAILLFTAILIPVPLIGNLLASPGLVVLFCIAMSMASGLISIWLFPWFARWAEQRLLGVPLPPQNMLETYATRITTSLSNERLGRLLQEQILPTLLIRQAALLRLDEPLIPVAVFTMGVDADQLPSPSEIPALLAQADRFLGRTIKSVPDEPSAWIRLALKLTVENKLVGLFLFGRRDPDDYYAANEIPTLKALAQQTALALINIEQTRQLSALYREDIQRTEAEHNRLARELHDDVLGQLATLMTNEDASITTRAYQSITNRIRQIIQGLRPPLLNYGLMLSITELAEEVAAQAEGKTRVEVQIADSKARYPGEVELQLYRIVQEACKNAVKHAKATTLLISGSLEEDKVELKVTDDGIGFTAGEWLDFSELLARKHFGLAGMFERAALISARIQITSVPKQGTQMRVVWKAIG